MLGTGHAFEKDGSSFINKTSYLENAETSCVGRALGMAGFGIDADVASADEVMNADLNQIANNKIDYAKVKSGIRDRLGKYFYQETECKPMILVVTQEISGKLFREKAIRWLLGLISSTLIQASSR